MKINDTQRKIHTNMNLPLFSDFDQNPQDFFVPSIYVPKSKTNSKSPIKNKFTSDNEIQLNLSDQQISCFIPKESVFSPPTANSEIKEKNNFADTENIQSNNIQTISKEDFLRLFDEVEKLEKEEKEAENQYKTTLQNISNERFDLIQTITSLETDLKALKEQKNIELTENLENECHNFISAFNDSMIDSLNQIINYQSSKNQYIRKVKNITQSLKTGKTIKYLNQVDEFINSLFV